MVTDIGLKWVVIGHSERRNSPGGSLGGACEDGAYIADKCVKCLAEGLSVIFCVGEMKDDRVAGNMEAIVSAQMQTLVDAGVKEFGERVVVRRHPVPQQTQRKRDHTWCKHSTQIMQTKTTDTPIWCAESGGWLRAVLAPRLTLTDPDCAFRSRTSRFGRSAPA